MCYFWKPKSHKITALNHTSHIDYILTSSDKDVDNFCVLDPDVNFSGHLPLFVVITCFVTSVDQRQCSSSTRRPKVTTEQLRWDRANLNVYYYSTGERLAPFLPLLNSLLDSHLDIYGDDSSSLHKNFLLYTSDAADE